MISVSDMEENIVGKGENAGLPAFSPFPKMFSEAFFCRVSIIYTQSKASKHKGIYLCNRGKFQFGAITENCFRHVNIACDTTQLCSQGNLDSCNQSSWTGKRSLLKAIPWSVLTSNFKGHFLSFSP